MIRYAITSRNKILVKKKKNWVDLESNPQPSDPQQSCLPLHHSNLRQFQNRFSTFAYKP